ncbi:hypothetical protein A1O3_00753 [Capronia epimyces CBS 606.96]|uniref:DUF7923 domain-containing protein n=1 Tax=Capronia epimyces CBS 606.96 TaxID=1182542 RepID=W9YI23_9EURO|nr:uncharacterized protein A1O3_00753 [Capronia epimyces CBS 606.96]EXJ92203.1 hypothetical protein A1O3_00753 [Capronia epimyces CBS 606.96]
MPLSSWFPTFKAPREGDHDDADEVVHPPEIPAPGDPPDIETIADRVEALQRELEYACHLFEQANLQIEKDRVEIHELKGSVVTLRETNEELQSQLAREKDKIVKHRAQSQQEQVTIKKQKALTTKLQARLDKETGSLETMTRHARSLERRMVDMQLDLEYFQCTSNAQQQPINPLEAQSQDAPLPAQPFVVVLVDGDAYKWNPDLFLNSNHLAGHSESDRSEPGGLAATRIRNEVIKYITKQDGTIPITSKVITRVFCNFGYEGQLLGRKRARSKQVALKDFAVQFTEKMPLFDYFDAGRGKERADDKIRENFHLYLSTPNCHAVFVAACLDNGFARMLEQYSNHAVAYRKIILVTPGYMGLEIQRLGFKQVMWSSVFATMTMSKNMAIKYEKGLQRQRSLSVLTTGTKRAANKGKGAKGRASGGADFDVVRFLLDRVPVWDVNEAMARYTNGVGLRMPPTYGGDEATFSAGMEHTRLEEGVD